MNVLRHNCFLTPLACSIHEDFSEYNLAGLQSLAMQALRAKKSIHESDRPVSLKEIQRFQVPRLAYLVLVIPGTDLIVLKSENGDAACWDTRLGQKLVSIHVGRDNFVCGTCETQEASGKCSITLIFSRDYDRL